MSIGYAILFWLTEMFSEFLHLHSPLLLITNDLRRLELVQ